MLRIVASLCLLFLCLWGENRIIRMVPFGDGNVKIVFAQDISDLTWQIKNLQGNKSFIDFEANLTIPRRNFIFKDNSTLQIAQNTPQVVRAVIATNPKSTYEVVKEKENLYIFIKPKGDSKQVAQSPKENLSTKSQIDDKQTSQHKQEQIAKNPPQKVEQKSKKIVI